MVLSFYTCLTSHSSVEFIIIPLKSASPASHQTCWVSNHGLVRVFSVHGAKTAARCFCHTHKPTHTNTKTDSKVQTAWPRLLWCVLLCHALSNRLIQGSHGSTRERRQPVQVAAAEPLAPELRATHLIMSCSELSTSSGLNQPNSEQTVVIELIV